MGYLVIICNGFKGMLCDFVAIEIGIDGRSLIYGAVKGELTISVELDGKDNCIEVSGRNPISVKGKGGVLIEVRAFGIKANCFFAVRGFGFLSWHRDFLLKTDFSEN